MRLDRFIESSLAYSARSVRLLFARRLVLLNGAVPTDSRISISQFCRVEVDGQLLQGREPIYVMLHKPEGCVSATRDAKHKTVLDYIDLPEVAELHLAGRLDFNTTGLLLLTNDGRWSRKLTQPGNKIEKRYWLQTADEIGADYVQKFAEGFYFRFENLTTQPAKLHILSSHSAQLSIYEGRYHQIKRMFGFYNNEVVKLHRFAVGPIQLDQALQPGDYRLLSAAEIAAVG